MYKKESVYREYAEIDKGPTKAGYGFGIYQCYCSKFSDNVQTILNGPDDFCYSYQIDGNITKASSNFVSILITIFNMVIRVTVVKAVNSIKLNFQSQVDREIMVAIFASIFVNTGLIISLTNANFYQTPLRYIIPIHNDFNDFTSEWYQVVGTTMIDTMIIAAFTPYF